VRFGRRGTLFGFYDYCATEGIAMYGRGFGELGPGRHHRQCLASLFHPDTPNDDIAPSGYNRLRLDTSLPTLPLTATPARIGFRWVVP
jgi:hypothetical protein